MFPFAASDIRCSEIAGHPTTRREECEAVYLFWLGIDLDVSDRKQRLFSDRKIEEDLQRRLKKENTLSQIKQSLLIIESELGELEAKKNSMNINENYETDIQSLNEVKADINRISTRISRLELRRELIEESIQELNQQFSNVDIERIQSLYDEAKALVPSVQRTFDETLAFHNGMIQQKKTYIAEELPSLKEELSELQDNLRSCLSSEKELGETLKKSGAMDVSCL